jgi:hypothetical protein
MTADGARISAVKLGSLLRPRDHIALLNHAYPGAAGLSPEAVFHMPEQRGRLRKSVSEAEHEHTRVCLMKVIISTRIHSSPLRRHGLRQVRASESGCGPAPEALQEVRVRQDPCLGPVEPCAATDYEAVRGGNSANIFWISESSFFVFFSGFPARSLLEVPVQISCRELPSNMLTIRVPTL